MAQPAARPAAKQEAKVTPVAEAKPKKMGWLLKIAIALVVLAGGAGAAWVAMEQPSATPEAAAAKAAAPQEKPPLFVTLESFTVNLQPEAGDQYLQVGLVLKVTDAATVDAVKLHMPEIRNRILLLLSGKKASEVSTVAGKQQLSAEIMKEAGQPIGSQKLQQGIVSVFFTSFVIQ